MALVSYSDSETSDSEEAPAPVPAVPSSSSSSSSTAQRKSAFQKLPTNPSEPRKIRVDLPSLSPPKDVDRNISEEEEAAHLPPPKRARTAGAFSGFNSLLPAPKRSSAQQQQRSSGLKAGVSLRTSGEAAFSRRPVDTAVAEENREEGFVKDDRFVEEEWRKEKEPEKEKEVKIVGIATKFKPLSVENNNKKKKKKNVAMSKSTGSSDNSSNLDGKISVKPLENVASESIVPPPPKPKKSLFSLSTNDEGNNNNTSTYDHQPSSTTTYEPLTHVSQSKEEQETTNSNTLLSISEPPPPVLHQTNNNNNNDNNSNEPTTLLSLASSLNLTPSQRRHLLGSKSKNANSNNSQISLSHFSLSSEYDANENFRQSDSSGSAAAPHRAVKTIAPGKHSLQQLVNNARGQQDAMEEKWAEGRRERGEAGGRYAWN